MNYKIDKWGCSDFKIHNGQLCVDFKCSPSLLDIVQTVNKNFKGPLLIRFPHLIRKQLDKLFGAFDRAMKEYEYSGSFSAVFPLKVNQFEGFVKQVVKQSQHLPYGFEAGSKAELILAMALNKKNKPIMVNGFKDYELVELGFIAANSGCDITVTIEGLNELQYIMQVGKKYDKYPKIGIRIRLHSLGVGQWIKSAGINSKFGLSATEVIEALELLKKNDIVDCFSMLHFHLGSQIDEIAPLNKALREAGNIYAELIKSGARALKNLNIGGGLAVEYSPDKEQPTINYSIDEFCSDVVFTIKTIADAKEISHPNIFTESGRFIAAKHAVLIAPALELFGQDYTTGALKLKKQNPPLVDELYELYQSANTKNAKEYLHDALDHIESLLTLFNLGYIDLIDRSNAEILAHLVIKKSLVFLQENRSDEVRRLANRLQDKYLLNLSIFQSLPDFWGLKQRFPIVPIHFLDQKPTIPAALWDITCDSDGEIDFESNHPLFLHEVNLNRSEYYLGFFLVGAYQEVLGMQHNLFSHPNEITVEIDQKDWKISNIIEADSILQTIENLDYKRDDIVDRLNHLNQEHFGKIWEVLNKNSYLK